MRGPCALLLVVLGLTAGAPLRADSTPARVVIRDCAQKAKSALVGLGALNIACPGLATAITVSGVAAHLPGDWEERLTPHSLADWSALADRYERTSASVSSPDSARLQTIAKHLQPPPPPLTWWERLKAWVQGVLDPERGHWPDWLRWPTRWQPGNSLLYGLLGLLLIGTVVVIVIELRAAGVLGAARRRRVPARRSTANTNSGATQSEELLQLEAAAGSLSPDRLLRLLVTALTRSHRLERARDLTCRELITAAQFDTSEQREIFADVALLAEKALYDDPSRAPMLDEATLGQSARGLYGELLAAPTGQSAK